jgi:hypothetical protein
MTRTIAQVAALTAVLLLTPYLAGVIVGWFWAGVCSVAGC